MFELFVYVCEQLYYVFLLVLIPAVTLLICTLADRLSSHLRGCQVAHKTRQPEGLEEAVATSTEAEKGCSCCCMNNGASRSRSSSNGGGGGGGAGGGGGGRGGQNPKKVLIAYATQSNTACKLAHKLFSILRAALHEANIVSGDVGKTGSGDHMCCRNGDSTRAVPEVRVLRLSEDGLQCSVEHLLESNEYGLVIFIASTYTDGNAPESSQGFAAMLQDAYMDFRVPRDTLAKTRCAVFGLGDTAYGAERFNRFAKDLHMWCKGLGATFVVPPVYASEANTTTLFNVFSTTVVKWIGRVVFTEDGVVVLAKRRRRLGEMEDAQKKLLEAGEKLPRTRKAHDSEEEEEEDDENENVNGDDAADAAGEGNGRSYNGSGNTNDDADDVEDLVMDDYDDDGGGGSTLKEPPELLYPRLRDNLERQGYHLVGSHSGVKLCRWTKAMLRGRGGCYKHTFYNIASYQCMEMTPSLACANKCVFCWRHHTNPVSRTFKWKVDPPQKLICEGIAGHQRMIKQMRGVPGVTPERLEEAMRVRHCALSLVGEPIMYPEINAFVDLLHERHISSFMVTNAQFPDQLRELKPVTQLYLSIDAPTPEELKRVDRPLFEDYWERCLACVRELRRKPQRTVFRLTLVNQYNMENLAAYADLVRLGWPDFIEVKGVTYCGTSTASTLTMKENVPRHEEVVQFCEALCDALAPHTPPRDKRRWLSEGETAAQRNAASASASACGGDDNGNDHDNKDGATTTTTTTNNNNNKDHDHNNKKNSNETNGNDESAVDAPGDGPYSIACEHEHSCCVLIALRRFLVQGVWHTWIDYDKFIALAQSGRHDFTAAEYAAPTPSWAVFRSEEKGFDPSQVRVRRKSGKATVVTSGC